MNFQHRKIIAIGQTELRPVKMYKYTHHQCWPHTLHPLHTHHCPSPWQQCPHRHYHGNDRLSLDQSHNQHSHS